MARVTSAARHLVHNRVLIHRIKKGAQPSVTYPQPRTTTHWPMDDYTLWNMSTPPPQSPQPLDSQHLLQRLMLQNGEQKMEPLQHPFAGLELLNLQSRNTSPLDDTLATLPYKSPADELWQISESIRRRDLDAKLSKLLDPQGKAEGSPERVSPTIIPRATTISPQPNVYPCVAGSVFATSQPSSLRVSPQPPHLEIAVPTIQLHQPTFMGSYSSSVTSSPFFHFDFNPLVPNSSTSSTASAGSLPTHQLLGAHTLVNSPSTDFELMETFKFDDAGPSNIPTLHSLSHEIGLVKDTKHPSTPPTRSQKRKSAPSPHRSPTLSREFECIVCGKRCIRKQDLTRHMATHTKEKAFVCHFGCGSAFGRADALGRHMRSRKCSGATAAAIAEKE